MNFKIDNNQILASSSAWVAAFLNFFPGLGVGYIYQRRWIAYWLTSMLTTVWVIFWVLLENSGDEFDPGSFQTDQISFYGLFCAAISTAIEAVFAVRKARQSCIG